MSARPKQCYNNRTYSSNCSSAPSIPPSPSLFPSPYPSLFPFPKNNFIRIKRERGGDSGPEREGSRGVAILTAPLPSLFPFLSLSLSLSLCQYPSLHLFQRHLNPLANQQIKSNRKQRRGKGTKRYVWSSRSSSLAPLTSGASAERQIPFRNNYKNKFHN